MTTFASNVKAKLASMKIEIKEEVQFYALANFTEKAGFNLNSEDAVWFATGVLVVTECGVVKPTDEFHTGMHMRAFGRAAVKGRRAGHLTGFYKEVRESIADGLLPADAEEVAMSKALIGQMAFGFYNAA
ncbi:hypothetical protein pETSU_166 [Edwardsiella phage pEt-SU]|uniref:Uncharacterized protein n=1 Tax=Edwardsiella phage pEt-SU TaxID=2562142 RepID=A0A4D6DWK3_9CAUD|nr:hypothetical protein HOV39_gp166 [Edwardsiella phage pEt-SU]QBZ70747.1 hypothetical protein pETSU_166 [Edwardsiella phage pEt-SU]